MSKPTPISAWLTKDEIKALNLKSDVLAWYMVVVNWVIVAFSFWLVIYFPHPITILLAIILIGGRQLGLAILMHECAHYSFFQSRQMNDLVGKWILAAPVFADLHAYRKYHLKHHRLAGTTEDPDYPNYKTFPISRQSLVRKLLRDACGITGIKNLFGLMLMYAGVYDYDLSYKPKTRHNLSFFRKIKNIAKNLAPPLLMQCLIAGLLTYLGHPELYLLWFVALITSFSVFTRIRNAAEHANVEDLLSPDPRKHTRTTYANWWERLTFAPNFVNYHMEHHLIPSVPAYRLPACHQMLKSKGALDGVMQVNGYIEVIKLLVQKRAV